MNESDGFKDMDKSDGFKGALSALPWHVKTRFRAERVLLAVRMWLLRGFFSATPKRHAVDWMVSFVIDGKAGETKTLAVNPQCLFRAEKLIATDSSGAGTDTRIINVFVGMQAQMGSAWPLSQDSSKEPVAIGNDRLGMSTAHFGPDVLGNGFKWKSCEKGLHVTISIYFHKDSRWEGTLFGKAML